MAKKTLYLVWNKAKNECVGFFDKKDAVWTSEGGRHPDGWTPTVGEAFRDSYAEDADPLPLTKVQVDG